MIENWEKYITIEQRNEMMRIVLDVKQKYNISYLYFTEMDFKIVFNSRMRTVEGNIHYKKGHFVKINLNPKHLEQFGFDSMMKVLKHELAHFVEFTETGDTVHTRRFKEICKEIGGVMNEKYATGEFKECLTKNYIPIKYNWHYKCRCGKNDFKTVRRLGKKKLTFVCKICNQQVSEMENKIN